MADPYLVPGTETWMEGDLRVVLALPQRSNGPVPVPVLLLLDGQSMFLTAAEYARTVTLVTMGSLPPVAVVGVWRDSADPLDYFSTRFRDFTPLDWVLPDPFADDNTMIRHGTGGADSFLELLVDRVLPAVHDRMEVSDTSIGGWSLSGLFAAWAWRERPDVFSHLLAMSPSLWWHHGRMLDEGVPARTGYVHSSAPASVKRETWPWCGRNSSPTPRRARPPAWCETQLRSGEYATTPGSTPRPWCSPTSTT